MKRAAIILTCLMMSSVASAAAPKKAAPDRKKVAVVPKRKVAVAAFEAPKESRARNSVLSILSEHDEIEVISLEDIAFEAHRVHVDAKSQAGREKIAEALGVELWIDGVVDGNEAHLQLTSTRGRKLAAADVRGTTPSVMDGLAGERMWAAMGPTLSAKENRRRTLLDQAELARTKITDREREMIRQTEVAVQRAAEHEKRLKAQHQLALSKRAAQQAELARQEKLVSDRKQSEEREQLRLAEQRRRSELAEQRRQQAMLDRQYSRPSNTGWGGGMSNPYQGSASRSGDAGARAPAYQPNRPRAYQPNPPIASPNSGANNSGLTASTQRWLQEQQGPNGAGPQEPPSASAAAPAQASSNAEQASPQIPEYAPPQISPATQRWLAQQQQQR